MGLQSCTAVNCMLHGGYSVIRPGPLGKAGSPADPAVARFQQTIPFFI